MTTLGLSEKRLRNRSKKGISGRCVPTRCESGPSRRRWKHRGPKPPKNWQKEVVPLSGSWNRRVKTEIPV